MGHTYSELYNVAVFDNGHRPDKTSFCHTWLLTKGTYMLWSHRSEYVISTRFYKVAGAYLCTLTTGYCKMHRTCMYIELRFISYEIYFPFKFGIANVCISNPFSNTIHIHPDEIDLTSFNMDL